MKKLSGSRHVILSIEKLWDSWVTVQRVLFYQIMRDGSSTKLDREISSRGDGVSTLLYHSKKQTVLLLRQPRIVSSLRGGLTGETLEVCSGLLGDATPEEGARREVLEETGYIPLRMDHVASTYESIGGSSDITHLFLGEYGDGPINAGGGIREEGEDIEIVEISLDESIKLMREGVIQDARTMLLLQHLSLFGLDVSASDPQK